MESFDIPSIYAQSMSLSQSPILCNASPAQEELFYSLPPDLQQIVFTGAWPDELRDSWQRRCGPNCGACSKVFNLRTIFLHHDIFTEYAHFRVHWMCTKCKEEHDRRAARRQERLDGLAHSQQVRANRDERAMEAEDYLQRNAPEYEETLEEELDRLDREMSILGLLDATPFSRHTSQSK